MFDRHVDWIRDDDYVLEVLHVEPGALKIAASTCWFTGDIAGSEIATKAVDLADEFPRYQDLHRDLLQGWCFPYRGGRNDLFPATPDQPHHASGGGGW